MPTTLARLVAGFRVMYPDVATSPISEIGGAEWDHLHHCLLIWADVRLCTLDRTFQLVGRKERMFVVRLQTVALKSHHAENVVHCVLSFLVWNNGA